jgi:hypothetical protein
LWRPVWLQVTFESTFDVTDTVAFGKTISKEETTK